jgi:hypothetical protein
MRAEATRRAKERSRIARWDLDVAVFLFVVLIIVIILLFQDISIGIVAPVALFGLVMVWVIGWRRGQHLYHSFYDEELNKLKKDMKDEAEKEQKEKEAGKPIEETVEEAVQRALRERMK